MTRFVSCDMRELFGCAALLAGVGMVSCCLAQGQAADKATDASPQAATSQVAPISEEELRQQLQGKTFYLRDGYLDNTLRFDSTGKLEGASPKASFTLSLVEIERVHLEKHRLELEGVRYGLHFLGASAEEDQGAAVDKVRLTTKKKPLRIAIERETVVKPKKEKAAKKGKGNAPAAPQGEVTSESAAAEPKDSEGKTTLSQAHANRALRQAVDRVFSPAIDDRVISTLPEYWKLFYSAVAQKSTFKPADPAVLRQGQVQRKAKLLTILEPLSNDYAQANGVAGMALYHVVVGEDGKAREIAIGRPIGFGLDENAVESIRKARFQPAMNEGKPVPVVLDVSVQFRIYSGRTAAASEPDRADAAGAADSAAGADAATTPATPKRPGPYTVRALQQQLEAQAASAPAVPAPAPPASAPQQ